MNAAVREGDVPPPPAVRLHSNGRGLEAVRQRPVPAQLRATSQSGVSGAACKAFQRHVKKQAEKYEGCGRSLADRPQPFAAGPV